MKKRLLSLLLVLVMVLGMFPMVAFAEPADGITVYMTVFNKGEFCKDKDNAPMWQKPVTVTDTNGDGKYSLDEALAAAHTACYIDGTNGYATEHNEASGYDAVAKLWGVDTKSTGYYRNNKITATVDQEFLSANDKITAFVYYDEEGWSDRYSYFTESAKTVGVGEEFSLTLKYAGYDADYNPTELPVATAPIGVYHMATGTYSVPTTLKGEETIPGNFMPTPSTGTDGSVKMRFTEPGTYYVTAQYNSSNYSTYDDYLGSVPNYLVPPVCVVTVQAPLSFTTDLNTDEVPYTVGDTATALTVTAEALNGGTLAYQWYTAESADAEGTAIDGAAQASYTPATTAAGTTYYYVTVSDGTNTITSQRTPVTVTIAKETYLSAFSVGTKTITIQNGVYHYDATVVPIGMLKLGATLSDAAPKNSTITYKFTNSKGVEKKGTISSGKTAILTFVFDTNSIAGNVIEIFVGAGEDVQTYTIKLKISVAIKEPVFYAQDGTTIWYTATRFINNNYGGGTWAISKSQYSSRLGDLVAIGPTEQVTCSFTPTAKDITKLSVNGQEQSAVYDGQKMSITVTPVWDNETKLGSITIVPSTDSSAEANAYIFTVRQTPKELFISKQAASYAYYEGNEFDIDGIEITAKYEDNSTKVIDSSEMEITPTVLALDTTEVVITYCGATIRIPVTVSTLNYDSFDGKGTESDPYLLKTSDDLRKFAALVNQDGAKGKHFRMIADITLPDDWTPAGTSEPKGRFGGVFDGGGFLLTIPEGGKPLFSYVREATIKNLNIYGTRIAGYGLIEHYVVDYGDDGSYGTDDDPQYIVKIDHVTLKSGTKTLKSGFIGGYASGINRVYITNCTAEKGVTIGYAPFEATAKGDHSIGTFAGDFNGYMNSCISYADVYGYNMQYVGGLVGAKGQAMGACVVENCAFYGTVNAENSQFAGGIMGSGYYDLSAPATPLVSVHNCLFAGTLIGGENVGGILGGEPASVQCWENGIGTVSDNLVFGTITGTKNVGAVVGYMHSLNKCSIIANNYYLDTSAQKGVGYIRLIDTSCETVDRSDSTVTYVNTEPYDSTHELVNAHPEWDSGIQKVKLNRTDDPLGADAEKLAKAMTADQMLDGTVVTLLNTSETSLKNWIQGENYPVLSSVPVAYELVAGGELQSKHYVGDALNLSGLTLTAKWSDGTTTNVPLNDPDLKITGYDSNKHGQQAVTLQYGAAKVEIVVTVLYKEPEKIAVTITLLGDTKHGDNGEVHGLSKGGLTAWVSGHEVEATTNMTVWDALQKLPNVKWENPTGNYIKGVTYGGVTLGELDNGKNSGWMYTLNDEYPLLGVSEQYLKKGDVIVFHYTDDYTHDFAFDADKKTAKEIVAMIAAIGTVDLGKGSAITAARTAYDALTDSEKALVTNYAVLTAAEKTYAGLVAGLSKKLDSIYKTTGDYLSKLGTPGVGSIGGEWMVLGLARSGRAVPSGYYDNVVKHVRENIRSDGRLDRTKTTENARIILALTAMGKDPTNVGGYNLLDGFYNMRDCLKKQGVNAPIFALLALDSHNYTPTHNDVTRDGLVELILSDQVKADGGWALEGADAKASDVDMTAMAIQSLAPYYDTDPTVREAVDKALVLLSSKQQAGGGFTSWGSANSESCAQVIVALTALGIDPASDSRFIKNGATMLDALCSYYVEGGGFKHTSDGTLNGMATEQGYYALAAYYRLVNKQTSLYDMTDVCPHSLTATAGKAATCTEAGNSAYWTCSRCHKYFSDAAGKTEIAKDSWIINALGHDVGTRGAVAATCYISGHEADTYCKRCGIVITAGATIPATGKHTYVDGVCTTCGTRNPAGGIKGDDLKVDSKDNTIVTGGGLTIKTDKPVTDEKLAEIKAAVENGSIVITVNNTPILQLTKEDKEADGGKNALMQAGAAASGELKKELDKLAEKLDALRGDSSKKNAQLEKIIDVTVELVKTNAVGSVESVAQLTELPRSVTVTVSITNELYDSLKDKRVCVVRSHTDANGNVTTTELPATLGGTRDNYVLTFQTDRASTFAIVSYAAVSSGRRHYTGGTTTGKVNSSNTGDDSQMTIWLGSAVMAAAAVVVLTYKKKRASK